MSRIPLDGNVVASRELATTGTRSYVFIRPLLDDSRWGGVCFYMYYWYVVDSQTSYS